MADSAGELVGVFDREPKAPVRCALSPPSSVDLARAFAQRSRIRTPTHSTSPTIAPATTPGIGCRRQTRPPATAPKTSPGQPMNRSTSTGCGPVKPILMSATRAPASGWLDHPQVHLALGHREHARRADVDAEHAFAALDVDCDRGRLSAIASGAVTRATPGAQIRRRHASE